MFTPETGKLSGESNDDTAVDDVSIEPDVTVVPDSRSSDVVEIGPELYLHPATRDRIEHSSSGSEQRPVVKNEWSDRFGPEVIAGIVIGLMFALFGLLMVLGVSNGDGDGTTVERTETAPEDIEVEIGTAVTLERE